MGSASKAAYFPILQGSPTRRQAEMVNSSSQQATEPAAQPLEKPHPDME